MKSEIFQIEEKSLEKYSTNLTWLTRVERQGGYNQK